jgi:hypothetical protein
MSFSNGMSSKTAKSTRKPEIRKTNRFGAKLALRSDSICCFELSWSGLRIMTKGTRMTCTEPKWANLGRVGQIQMLILPNWGNIEVA